MQAFCCEVVRALTKLGIAIAASNPIMATTIMISTSVNPALRLFFVCIMFTFAGFPMRRERCKRRVINNTFPFTNCLLLTAIPSLAALVPLLTFLGVPNPDIGERAGHTASSVGMVLYWNAVGETRREHARTRGLYGIAAGGRNIFVGPFGRRSRATVFLRLCPLMRRNEKDGVTKIND